MCSSTSEERIVQSGTRCDRYQDSVVADKSRKLIKCKLTHDEDNFDETDAATVSSELHMTTVSAGRTTMCEDAKFARIKDNLNVLETLSIRNVSKTDVYVGSLICSYVGDVAGHAVSPGSK